jgi:hypothetical protein
MTLANNKQKNSFADAKGWKRIFDEKLPKAKKASSDTLTMYH